MIPPFDIFWTADGNGPIWRETLPTLDEAKARVEELGKTQPGHYLIFSQTTGHKIISPHREFFGVIQSSLGKKP